MTVTDEGKKVFEEAIKQYNKPIVHIGLYAHHCGGLSLDIQLIEENQAKRVVEYNGVRFDIDEKHEQMMSGFIFDGQDGKLTVRNATPNTGDGGCCGGHGDGGCCHGEGEHECCGGHGEGEHECCGGHGGCCHGDN